MKSIHIQGRPANDSASKVCVLYDPADGSVVHVHGVTTIPGGKELSQAEMEQRTIAHAKALGRQVEGLKHLHLPVSAIHPQGRLKVNPEGTGLVPAQHRPSAKEALAQYQRLKHKRT
jgi:hypothetical protein